MALELLMSLLHKGDITFEYKCGCLYTLNKESTDHEIEETLLREMVINIQNKTGILVYMCLYDKWATQIVSRLPYFMLNSVYVLDTLDDENLLNPVVLQCVKNIDFCFHFYVKIKMFHLDDKDTSSEDEQEDYYALEYDDPPSTMFIVTGIAFVLLAYFMSQSPTL